MALQPVFKHSYIEHLKTHIRPSEYMGDHFEYDRSQVVRLYGIQQPEDLLQKLDPSTDGDLKSAIAIYEAYKDITPLFAQQDDLWVYLTHVDLFEYVKKRWPIKGEDNEKQVSDIQNHWFRHNKHLFRTPVAGLWWQVFLTKDDERENPYELTEYLFKNQEFRTVSFGELPLIRHREAMIGILEFLKENEHLFEGGFNAKARYIRRLFFVIGGYKNLTFMSRGFFKETLYEHIEQIESLHDAKDVTVGSDIYNDL